MNRIALASIARLASIALAFVLVLPGIAAAAAPTWTKLSPTAANLSNGIPSQRYNHTAVYDEAGNNMIVYAGCANSGCPNGEVWVLSNANGSGPSLWTKLSPTPDPTNGTPLTRDSHTAVYDAAGNNLIVFDGYHGSAISDVWVLSNANGSGTPAWTKLSPSPDLTYGAPAARYQHSAVYDELGNNMIVYGGCRSSGGCPVGDVWVLSHANGDATPAWTKLLPTPDPVNGTPAARSKHTAVYDAAGNNMIVYAGCAFAPAGCPAGDVWVLSHANGNAASTWSKLSPSPDPTYGTPPARWGHTAVYDEAGNNLIVFDGYNGSANLDDAWVLSHANGSGGTPAWTKLSPGPDLSNGTPAARHGHTSVYDATGNHMIVFDGYVSGVVNEVWVLNNASPFTPPVNVAVNIDIRPNTAVNTISLTLGTEVPVAILSSASFDATTQVDRTSLTFGHAGTEASFKSCNLRAADVNADGYKDLVCHFNGTLGGFALGDTTGYLQGKTLLGGTISGNDTVNIIK